MRCNVDRCWTWCSMAFLGIAMGCTNAPEPRDSSRVSSDPASLPVTPPPLKVGDEVVAKWSSFGVAHGVIESMTDDKVLIKWSDGIQPSEVLKEYVFHTPRQDYVPDVKSGDVVVARPASGTQWTVGVVTDVNADQVNVRSFDGGQSTVEDRQSLVLLSERLGVELKISAAKNRLPKRPTGYVPVVGEPIITLFAPGSWQQGKVASISGDMVNVEWDDGSSPSQKSFNDITPIPPITEKITVQIGECVLVKLGARPVWELAVVRSINDSQLEAVQANHKSIQGQSGAYLPLQ